MKDQASGCRVFLTGATGFVGSHVAKRLVLAGAEVHALCRIQPPLPSSIHWHVGDLRDRPSLEKALVIARPDVIIHCGAYGIRRHEQSHEHLVSINIQGTLSLMQLASRQGAKRWIQTGSCSEYSSQEGPLSETVSLIPSDLYGVTKVASTLLALQQGIVLNMPTIVLRLFNVYGPSEPPGRLIPTLLLSSLTQQPTFLSSGHKIRDFVYVEDIADLYVDLAITPHFPAGEIFNVGSGVPTPLQGVGNIVETLTGRHGYFLWGKNPDRPHERLSIVADITKSRNILHWSPKTSLEKGLAKMVQTSSQP